MDTPRTSRSLLKLGFTIFTALAAASLIVPIGAQAAGQLVTLVDSDGDSQTQVDDGELRIGDGTGPLTVDGVVATRAEEAGSTPVLYRGRVTLEPGDHGFNNEFTTVRLSQRLLVTHVSADFQLPQGQTPERVWLLVRPPGQAPYYEFFLSYGSVSDTAPRHYHYTHHLDLPVPGGSRVKVVAQRAGGDTGTANLQFAIAGYLIDTR